MAEEDPVKAPIQDWEEGGSNGMEMNLALLHQMGKMKTTQFKITLLCMTLEEALTAAITSDPGDPKLYAEVLRHPDKEKWIKAMIKEIKNFQIRRNPLLGSIS